MNDDTVKGRGSPLHGKLTQPWGRLTDDDLRRMDGHREHLAGKVPERYGIAREKADAQFAEFERSLR